MAKNRQDPEVSSLETFAVTPASGGYVIRIEDQAGEVLSIFATYDQLELIADSLDEVLESDDAAEVDDEDEDEDLDEDEDED